VAILLVLGPLMSFAQAVELPTRGREFWVGYMQNAYGAQGLNVQIASPTATSGTVSMPLTGWSQPFAVAANSVTTVAVPASAEHIGSEVVMNKGVLVQALDSVTVTALNFQSFTTDGAQVIPTQGLGTSYRAEAYRGLPGFADFYKSEALIVATQDGSEIQIVPSVNTSGGHAAGVPFIINLNAGETYQLQGALAALDLTGTSITGTANNGPCRPFAVFGGSMCANVPTACPGLRSPVRRNDPDEHLGYDLLHHSHRGLQHLQLPHHGQCERDQREHQWSSRRGAQRGSVVSGERRHHTRVHHHQPAGQRRPADGRLQLRRQR
jgi:hypothetical protein